MLEAGCSVGSGNIVVLFGSRKIQSKLFLSSFLSGKLHLSYLRTV